MALRLEVVAVYGVSLRLRLRRKVLKVHSLATTRVNAGGYQHQPRQHLSALRRRVLGQIGTGFSVK